MATCNAGHGCTIKCSNGCLAIYWLPNGPCKTSCGDSLETLSVPKDARFSVSIQELSARSVARVFSALVSDGLRSTLEKSDRAISLSIPSCSLDDLERALQAQL